MRKIYNIFLALLVMFMVSALPVMAAEDDVINVVDSSSSSDNTVDTSSSSSGNTIHYSKWFNPAESMDEVEKSPAGKPFMKLSRLVMGGVILYGLYRIVKAYLRSKSEDGESASDGYVGMGHATIGGFVLVCCIAFYFYFITYNF